MWRVRIGESRWSGSAPSRAGLGAALALLAAVGVSCGSLPKINYYALRVPAAPETKDPNARGVLGIERFRAAEVLRDDRIVYYESPTQLNFYQYHRWGSDPATLLTDLVARRLSQTGVFSEVRRLPSPEPVDYVLRGHLLNFEEVDYEAGVKGRVALEMTLFRSRDHKVVWSERRQVESAAEGKGVAGVVNALNAASVRLLDEVLPALIAQVERDLQQGSQPSQ
jgi:ABC-type uncharacterized transport system auxiliary subunit